MQRWLLIRAGLRGGGPYLRTEATDAKPLVHMMCACVGQQDLFLDMTQSRQDLARQNHMLAIDVVTSWGS